MEPTAPFNLLNSFWQTQLQIIEESELDFKNFPLPLARIKKVMKVDDDVKHMMISAEAPIVFAKACEIFILELTLRSWIQTEDNKRRTLQRADVTNAVAKNDVFDFLIDILPQRGEDGKGAGKRTVDAVDFRPPATAATAGNEGYFYSAPMNFNLPADPNLMYNQQQMNYLRQPYMQQDQSNAFHNA